MVKLAISKIQELNLKFDVVVSQGLIGIIFGSWIAQKLNKPFVPLLDNDQLTLVEDG